MAEATGAPRSEQEVGPCPECGWLIDTNECIGWHEQNDAEMAYRDHLRAGGSFG